MDTLKVDVNRMMQDAKAKTMLDLANHINDKGVPISQRTLFRWRRGDGFTGPNFMRVVTAMEYDDPLSLLSVGPRGQEV